jgi:hypothetical protein
MIVNVAVCFTEPDVAVTVAVVVVAALVVDVLDEPPQPESTPSPAAAIAIKTSSIRRRLFLRPRKQTAAASVNGNSGRVLFGFAAAVADGLIESEVLAPPPDGTVIGFGLKVHE